MDLTRRQLLGTAGVFSASALLAGCAGFSRPDSGGGEGGADLTFTTWASESEEVVFRSLVDRFQEANGVTVNLNVVPYEQIFRNIDAQLQSGTAPDVFRVDYGNLGVYSSQEQLLDLSDLVDNGNDFIPAFWQAVQFDGTPFGVPHQTDVSAIVYNVAAFQAAGITSVPDSLESAWTWDEFSGVLAQLRGSLPPEQYPFVYNWQLGGAPRWLSFLFAAGGRFVEDDLVTPAIDSDAGRRALDYTKGFFEQSWVPANSAVKSSTYADAVFLAETAVMASAGSFVVPGLDAAGFEWATTYLPRDQRGATDLGGNALVATAGTANPDLAAEFLRFMVEQEAMAEFCAATNELPTLTSLVDTELDYAVRPDVMPVFVQQATTLEESDVAQLTIPGMASVTTALQDQLDLAFTSGQSTEQTLANLSDAIGQATGA
ncbi:ABC transporter substrate-binding protein [Herbiconiux sp. SYSU D00978]|uniref:ABC transporter substrate-binding protein n=1 Tax=Herbiconiux sp. SYSU D00978 TaxID=2812562 RepID=UPI001A9676E4|nr:sugar ABC transporter substrate-binding protein [Herbiconiux sp. SYSU D00978]